jgi:hypothetical protein
MRKTLSSVAVVICLLFTGCNKAEISRDKFVDLLVDIHLADGYLTQLGYRADREPNKVYEGYGYILNKHQVTQKQFMNTLKYYSKHIQQYDEVYNQVIEKLSRMESEVNGEKINIEKLKEGAN